MFIDAYALIFPQLYLIGKTAKSYMSFKLIEKDYISYNHI